MNVFENLEQEKAKELYDGFIAEGMSEDEAFDEVYSIECNMDEDWCFLHPKKKTAHSDNVISEYV